MFLQQYSSALRVDDTLLISECCFIFHRQSSPLKSTLITPLPGTPLSMEINKTATFSGLTRPDLDNYCPASNLAFNEKIKRWQEAGETVYHFGFGQSPFPVIECMVRALREHAGENAYLPVTGIVWEYSVCREVYFQSLEVVNRGSETQLQVRFLVIL